MTELTGLHPSEEVYMKMDHGLVIVAIPRDDDYVWKISSEKVPHMTLCYLGEPDLEPEQLANMTEYVGHATSQLHRFWMSVDRRGKLGPNDADVLFFDKGINHKLMNRFRSNLLANDEINAAYQSAEQYPEWTPHLTLGYPESPAKPDARDYGFNGVEFDKISLWTSDFEGPTFQIPSYDHDSMEVAMSVQDLIGRGEEYLEHYGVKGMKWGKRRARIQNARSSDFIQVKDIRDKAKSTKTSSLSNQELQTAITRMNLEQQFTRLNPTKRKKGQAFVKALLGAGKTANEVVAFNNSPAGQQIRNSFAK